MLPSSLTLPPVGAVAATGPAVAIGDGRQAAFQRALQSLVGQSVTGEVLARFDDGSFMVNVAEHGVRMQLPADASIGSRLPLTVLSAEPRASFELRQPSSSVVLYGEAHAGDGTADLYSPPPHASPAGSAPNGTAASAAALFNSTKVSGSAAASPSAEAAATGAAAAAPTGTASPGAAAQPALAASLLAAAGNSAPVRNPLSGRLASPAGSGTIDADSAGEFATGSTDTASLPGTGSSAAAAGSAAARAHHSAASLLGKAPLTPLADLPGLDGGTAQPELSGAARILGSLLGQPISASALPLLGKTALFGHAAPDPAQLAQTLQNSIEESGLFYESHLAAWSRGERSLEQLQREPQMQSAQQTAQQASRQEGAPLDRAAAQQVNQQLLTQEQARVQWQGEAWPGQPLQWEIQRQSDPEQRERRDGGGETAPATIWRSSLRLRFAALGNLSATITIVGQQVHLQLLTEAGDSRTTLRDQAPVLSASMVAAGIPLSSLNIDQDDDHDG